jgi:hypothetical protein
MLASAERDAIGRPSWRQCVHVPPRNRMGRTFARISFLTRLRRNLSFLAYHVIVNLRRRTGDFHAVQGLGNGRYSRLPSHLALYHFRFHSFFNHPSMFYCPTRMYRMSNPSRQWQQPLLIQVSHIRTQWTTKPSNSAALEQSSLPKLLASFQVPA